MNEALPNATRIFNTLTALRTWAEGHGLHDAKDRIERMRISGHSAKMTVSVGAGLDAPLPPDADEKITLGMARQMVNALEGSIQIAQNLKAHRSAGQHPETVQQLRDIHTWAHDLSEAGKLPLKKDKLGRAKHKIEYLGTLLQQIDFGGRSMTGGNSYMGARGNASSFAARTGDALYQKELDREDDRTP